MDLFSYESLICPNLQTWLFSCYCRCQMPHNPITRSLPLAHVHKYIGSTTVIVLHVSPFEPQQSISCRVLCLGSTLCYFTIDNIFKVSGNGLAHSQTSFGVSVNRKRWYTQSTQYHIQSYTNMWFYSAWPIGRGVHLHTPHPRHATLPATQSQSI